MRRVRIPVSLLATVVMAATLGLSAGTGLASYVERITGVVQDWSAEGGFLVVDGVRYEFGPGIYLVDENGLSVPFSQLNVGARVSLLEHHGAVIEIALVREE